MLYRMQKPSTPCRSRDFPSFPPIPSAEKCGRLWEVSVKCGGLAWLGFLLRIQRQGPTEGYPNSSVVWAEFFWCVSEEWASDSVWSATTHGICVCGSCCLVQHPCYKGHSPQGFKWAGLPLCPQLLIFFLFTFASLAFNKPSQAFPGIPLFFTGDD